MKNFIIFMLFLVFSFGNTFASDIEDNSIIDELGKQDVKTLDFDFNLKSFKSCDGLENVMGKYIKDYWLNNKDKFRGYPVMYKSMGINSVDMAMNDSVTESTPIQKEANVVAGSNGGTNNYSKTNIQVDGVDESDIVKTDGKYIYYYNESDKYVYIVKVGKLKVIKKIKLPNNFDRPVLYIGTNRLTIISNGYTNTNYSKFGYWINRNAKTYTIVFDTTNIEKPSLVKLYVSDGNLKKTRKIGDYIYVISNNYFNIPYRNFKSIDDINIDINKILPKKIDISKTSNKEKQNLRLRGLNLPYNIVSGNVAKCNDIEYVLPDAETMKKFDFNPSYNIISIIDTKNTDREVKTKVIAGSNAELYMSLDNMYLISNIYQTYDFKCSSRYGCFMPWYPRGQNTLVHKINVNGNELKYQKSTIIPGSPLTQYSMDEFKGDFRILTSTNTWGKTREQHTDLYILDKNLDLKGSLKNLGNGENFKASRYIGNKLYLVSFKQIDPFFVIDMTDSSNPKVLGELKIPGYSTYLHPYDENHLIGLGYNTKKNKWGGTINNGLKVDLYDISDFKNPKQEFSYTLGEYGSYSEALTNPRMFMWKGTDKKLFLPVTLYKNDSNDQYRHTDFFQGLVTLTIDDIKGIKEDYRISHIYNNDIENQRKKECSKYIVKTNEQRCHKLLNGSEYCEPSSRQYIPKYCYADSKIGEYMASRMWNYRNSFIKRALWIGDNVISLSDDLIRKSDINFGTKNDSVKIGK